MRLPRGDPCRSPGERPGTCFTLFVWTIGRLAPGVSIAQARTELAGIAGRLAVHDPDLVGGGVDVVTLHERLYGGARPLLLILLGVVGFVLLIACANVASRSEERRVGKECRARWQAAHRKKKRR